VGSRCVSLDSGGHDHRLGVSEVWRQHERGVAWRRCARARHGAVVSCSYRGQRERGTAVAPWATRTQRPGAPPTPTHLLRIFTEVEDGGARRFALMAVRCIGTPRETSTTTATFLDSNNFFCSTATTTSHLSTWLTTGSFSLNAWI
jgi:hypothetical protein